MRALLVGDAHLQVQRLDDNLRFLKKVRSLGFECDTTILLGDLFHTFSVVRVEILAQWNEFFDNVKGRVISLVGNHDYASSQGGRHALEVFSNRIEVVDEFRCIDGIYFLPFMRDDKAFEAECRTIPSGKVLICHQTFKGAVYSSGTGSEEGADPACVQRLAAVISGHIHGRQQIKNIFYPGTPYQQDFGEAGQSKRVYSVALSEGGYEILEEHDLGMPEFVDIRADQVSEIGLPEPIAQNSYRVISRGSPAEITSFWSDPKIKEFRSKVRRLVDGITADRPEASTQKVQGDSPQERFSSFISGRKWRTSADRVESSARTLFGQ